MQSIDLQSHRMGLQMQHLYIDAALAIIFFTSATINHTIAN